MMKATLVMILSTKNYVDENKLTGGIVNGSG